MAGLVEAPAEKHVVPHRAAPHPHLVRDRVRGRVGLGLGLAPHPHLLSAVAHGAANSVGGGVRLG